MKDGTVLEGAVVEEVVGDHVTIKTLDGKRETINWDEVKRVVRADTNQTDRLTLKDGTQIEGRVLAEKEGEYVIIQSTAGKKETIPWAEVKRLLLAPGHQVGESEGTADVSISKNGINATVQGDLPEAEARRQEWLKRGGSIIGYDVQATFVYLQLSSAKIYGGGGGAALHATYYYFSPPDPTKGQTTWFAGRVGSGLETNALYIDIDGQSVKAVGFNVPVTIGAQVGLGGFIPFEGWRGVMLGVDYKPSYTYSKFSLKDSKGNDTSAGGGSFNFYGFQITLDFVKLHSIREGLEKQLKEANYRLSLFFLPPVAELPLFAIVGFGATWY